MSRLVELRMRRVEAASIGFWTHAFFSSLGPIAVTLGVGAALLVHGDLVVRMGFLLAGLVAAMGARWSFGRLLARRGPAVARIDAEIAALLDALDARRTPGETDR